MAFPSTYDSFSNPQGTTFLASDDHALQHRTEGSAIVGIETTIGSTSGTNVLKNFNLGNFAARTAGETMTNTAMQGYYTTPQGTTVAAGGTATLDLSLSNEWRVTFGTGNATLSVSNALNGMKFLVSLAQDSVGGRTVTWFPTVRWQDNTAPTLSTGGTKIDLFGFDSTSGTTFLGCIVSQGH